MTRTGTQLQLSTKCERNDSVLHVNSFYLLQESMLDIKYSAGVGYSERRPTTLSLTKKLTFDTYRQRGGGS